MAKKANIPHILIIRLSAMGDVAMTVPVIIALKRRYPDIKISLATKPHLIPIFTGINGLNIIPVHVKTRHKGLLGLWKLYKEIKPLSITHIADLHNVIRSKILRRFFTFENVSIKQINKGRAEKRMLTKTKNKRLKPLKFTVQRYADVLNALGFKIELEENDILEKCRVTAISPRLTSIDSIKTIGIAPFAAYESKMYDLDQMQIVIKELTSKYQYTVLLFGGGENEIKKLRVLSNELGDNVLSVAGELDFEHELALISNLDLMISMDSGNGHLAANYGVPVLTIWGVTHPYAGFGPYRQPIENSIVPNRDTFPLLPTSIYGNAYPEGYKQAINSISPQQIIRKVQEILGRTS